MQDPLRDKIRQWQVLYIVLPLLLLLLLLLVQLWFWLQHDRGRVLDQLAQAAQARVEQVLLTESVRLATVANQPTVVGLIAAAQRRDTANERPDDLEFDWANAARDNLMVRGVLDNDVAAAFVALMKNDAHIERMMLVDSRGRLLAASEKPERYFQNNAAWWKHGRAAPAGQSSATAIDSTGRVAIISAVLRPGVSNLVDGLMLTELNLADLLAGRLIRARPEDVVFLLQGKEAFPVAGTAGLVQRVKADLAPFLAGGLKEGWARDYRFTVRRLDAGLAWRQPVLLVSALRQPRIAAATLFSLLGGLAAGIVLIWGVYLLARRFGTRWFFQPMREASEAGVWIMRVAYADQEPKPPLLQAAWTEALTERTSKIQRELTRWLNKWRQELQAQNSTFSLELKRDLEMATEFQQAFLSRPYPVIPEVHIEGRLRLEFNHRYLPALAMGGDFFDISQLAPDCAGILVADVMGHGTRSALIVSILRTLIAELSRRGRNAPHFLRELNTNFCAMLQALPSPFFASAAYLVADTTSRMATYAVAGHPPPFFLHRAMGRVTRLEIPKPQGAALGLMPGEEYGGGTVRLNAGDAFLFFTDGVYEAANASGEEFGLARLEKVIRTHVYRSSAEILDAVIRAIQDFVGEEPVADDVCLVMVDITDKPVKK